jgi:hypothetical protein
VTNRTRLKQMELAIATYNAVIRILKNTRSREIEQALPNCVTPLCFIVDFSTPLQSL